MIDDPDYARIYTQMRCIAWQYGYTCCLIGSHTRDLDMVLVPWDKQARGNFEQLVRMLIQACPDVLRKPDVKYGQMQFTEKMHGRLSYSIHFKGFGDRRWVDLSIMPFVAQEPVDGS